MFSRILLLLILVLTGEAVAQTRISNLDAKLDPRGAAELTVCSQNLKNFGLYPVVRQRTGLLEEDYKVQVKSLTQRFASQKCDVIAVQEVLGKNDFEAKQALDFLAQALRRRTNREFESRTAPSNDKFLRLGFLVATDRADIFNFLSYNNIELPKFTEEQKPRFFTRGPLEIQLMVRGRNGAPDKPVTLINMHFKSQRGGVNDPAQLQWETFRMEMAEALRRVSEKRHARSFSNNDTILIVLGDRNSNFDSSSAQILEGSLTLKHFWEGGPCRMSKRGVPLCKAGSSFPRKLFSVLTGDPETKQQHGTYRYKGEYSWIDEILMPQESLNYAWEKVGTEGNYASGVVSEPREASDHSMVWVRLNW